MNAWKELEKVLLARTKYIVDRNSACQIIHCSLVMIACHAFFLFLYPYGQLSRAEPLIRMTEEGST